MEAFVSYALVFLLAWPLGGYMARVFRGERTWLDPVLLPLERAIYRLLRVDPERGMDWRGYALAVLWSNLPIALIGYALFLFQDRLPLNPDGVGPMSWDLALHTVASFITNTNQQHYSGQAQLSYLSQLAGVVAMQVITPAVGMAAMVAVLRGVTGGLRPASVPENAPLRRANLGNYYVDVTRAMTRVLIPLSFVLALLLSWQGVPSTLAGARTATLVEPQTVTTDAGSETVTEQRIPVGPVAPMVAIKQLGTNGGGWYGPNSAVPLENPTPLSNLLQVVSILLIPVAGIFMIGHLTRRPRFGVMVMGVMVVLSAATMFVALSTVDRPNAAFAGLATGPNMESVEQRFGPLAGAVWATFTTNTSNGSVNAMHDSFNPVTGLVPFVGMWLNLIFGGDGVGFLNFFVYLIVTVFIAGLMVGRTPELFGRKVEAKEMKLASVALLLSPFLILVPSALTLAVPGVAANSNPAFHGLSQVVYEYSSAMANNGSGFEGLGDNTVWWNTTTAIVLILARYIPIIAPLAIAGLLAAKKAAPETPGTLGVDTPVFAGTTLAVILVVGALEFFPVAVLGPIAEGLSLGRPLPEPVPIGSSLDAPPPLSLERPVAAEILPRSR